MHCEEVSGGGGELLYAAFNQDSGCFACGLVDGFAVYNVDPFRETFRRVFTNGGIGIVEMLFRCNLLAIVGGGRNPRYPPNKVMIWDDHENKCIGELMFKSEVHAVRLRRERVVVVLATKVFVYRFRDLKLVHEIKTVANPRGLVSQSVDSMTNILAIPGPTRGTVRVELFDIEKATLIKAHDAELAQFALNFDGTRLATASDKGTLIRLWDTHTGEPLRELRRGTDRAEIYCIAFNLGSTFLACSSDKGTAHIFSLSESARANPAFPQEPSPTPLKEGSAAERERSALSPGEDVSSSGNKSMGLGLDFLRKVRPSSLLPSPLSHSIIMSTPSTSPTPSYTSYLLPPLPLLYTLHTHRCSPRAWCPSTSPRSGASRRCAASRAAPSAPSPRTIAWPSCRPRAPSCWPASRRAARRSA